MGRALLASLAALATLGAVAVGAALVGPEDTAPPAPYVASPLSSIDTTALTVPRTAFCERVDPRAISAALDADPETSRTWTNGDRIRLDRGSDVVAEFGCSWTAGAVTARAWVFASVVTVNRARGLAKADRGCEALPGAAFGDPSVVQRCQDRDLFTSYRGLFGDAWLTCELSNVDEAARADGWCAEVARAASARDDDRTTEESASSVAR
jgi:hypothetical protein